MSGDGHPNASRPKQLCAAEKSLAAAHSNADRAKVASSESRSARKSFQFPGQIFTSAATLNATEASSFLGCLDLAQFSLHVKGRGRVFALVGRSVYVHSNGLANVLLK